MKFRLSVLALASLVAATAAAQPQKTVEAMVALDRAYIPALALSGQADQAAKAKVALASFEKEWKQYRDFALSQPGFDETLWRDIETVDAILVEAKIDLLIEGNGPKAHEALEGVRMTFLDFRQERGIPYFLDYVTLYHNAMEDILNDKPAKPLKDWSGADRLSFEADLDIAMARWNKVKAMEALLAQTELAPQKSVIYSSQWLVIRSIMADAKAALESGDDKVLSEKLAQLKPNFTKTFFLFGDFAL